MDIDKKITIVKPDEMSSQKYNMKVKKLVKLLEELGINVKGKRINT